MAQKSVFIADLPKEEGKQILLQGWVDDIRVLGGISFIILRDSTGYTQITAPKSKVDKKILDQISTLHQEDVIQIQGKLVQNKESKYQGLEIIPEKVEVINTSQTPLPLNPRALANANPDTRLDWRVLEFRNIHSRAVFKIQTQIINSFREFFYKKNFYEMQPPVIIPSASEGGAELFSIPYFEKQAFLAQSPQLYKQIGAVSLGRVFSIMPVFRAEKHATPTHLNEIRQMDCEVAFIDDQGAMDLLEECFIYILTKVKQNNENELKTLEVNLNIPKKIKRFTYDECIKLLQKQGESIKWGDDFTKDQEKKLFAIIGEDAFFLHDWPIDIKPFYAMPDQKNPKVCKAFDLIYKGLEISSGAQRIHIPDILIKQLKSKNLDPDDFKFYIDSFRYGAPPHAGWSLGLERVTMKICGLQNVREATQFPRDRFRITP